MRPKPSAEDERLIKSIERDCNEHPLRALLITIIVVTGFGLIVVAFIVGAEIAYGNHIEAYIGVILSLSSISFSLSILLFTETMKTKDQQKVQNV
jgi:hypothetical protein